MSVRIWSESYFLLKFRGYIMSVYVFIFLKNYAKVANAAVFQIYHLAIFE